MNVETFATWRMTLEISNLFCELQLNPETCSLAMSQCLRGSFPAYIRNDLQFGNLAALARTYREARLY